MTTEHDAHVRAWRYSLHYGLTGLTGERNARIETAKAFGLTYWEVF